jgi:hypothetical protein
VDKKLKWHRREILGGLLTAGVGLPILALSPLLINSGTQHQFIKAKELIILDGLLREWTYSWPMLSKEPLEKDLMENFDDVLKVVRSDKRADLLMALKMLTYGPSCYFLTGYLSPWQDPDQIKKIIKRWSETEDEVEGALFHAFSTLISAAYYSHPNSGQKTGYPGPPEIAKGGL